MNRKLWHELLAQYLTGSLSDHDRAEFDRCLQDDETCRAELREWRVIAAAVKQDADARVEHVPPLLAAFYERLGVQPSANGSLRLDEVTDTDMEESMTALVGSKSKEKRKRAQGRPVTLAAALGALLLGGLLLLASGGGRPPGVPLASVMEQDTTPVPEVDMNSIYLTATAIIVNATETKMAVDGISILTPVASTVIPVVPSVVSVVTATPIPVQAIDIAPTVVPPVSSGMQPIVAAPARLAGEAQLQVSIQEGGVLLSPDGARLAVLSVNGTARLLNAATLEQIELIVPAATTITHVSFSPDSTLLAVGQADGDVRLLDARTGAQLDVIEGDGLVSGLVFGGEGKLLAILRSASTLNTLWLYGLETGRKSAVIVYDIPLAGAAFSPDGSQIIVGTLDGRVLALAVGGE
ncbi:MAG: hypothetical protein DWB42_17670 [Chloroflexi bacterium]|nr:hypothetical protein [Chloroflexota bacterium]MDL1885973.1 hypothetical protein [Anaerolineae bacterium CFX8]